MRILAGKKTIIGYLMVLIGAGLYVASLWYMIPDEISFSVAAVGYATMKYGHDNRFRRVFYKLKPGGAAPNMNRPRLDRRRLKEGDMVNGR